MSVTIKGSAVPWWKEPTKDQWYAYTAAWLGWTLDAFDFTVFLLIMTPISQEFGVPLIEVTAVFTVTLIAWPAVRLRGRTQSRTAAPTNVRHRARIGAWPGGC